MKQNNRQLVVVFSAVLMLALAFITLVAMVIAPPCTGIMQKADAYKIASLCIFLGAFYLLVWRRRSLFAAMVLPASQILSGLLFASYLNSLSLDCAQ